MGHPDPVFVTADVSWADFNRGLPHGRYRVVINPELAQKYVAARLLIKLISLPVLGIGVALAISGYPLAGLPLVALGLLLPRIVKKKAPQLLLHLVTRDAAIYKDAIEHEILEVREPARPDNDA
ncbi:hypothetical protein [Lacisediminimonas profundi]|uniref:hypothetical protein n=1 Tax=Lacisediminimonas profundi TaxID=2603856 RepID=UPI00124B7359|nr:hypothetical protein [Lacisediminimonas profundi]